MGQHDHRCCGDAIDFYLECDGDDLAQYSGATGYLREDYGCGVSAIEVLCPESWADTDWQITTERLQLLRSRLQPNVWEACQRRYYDDPKYAKEHYYNIVDFVLLAEKLLEAGLNPHIHNSY